MKSVVDTRAIVVGGSLAGFCCATVLGRLGAQVTLVERDELPEGPSPRPGVPQGRHAHAILDRGRRELEALFPGFEARMVERGAVVIDPGLSLASRGGLGWAPRTATSTKMMFASRDLTDTTVREFARGAATIDVRTRTEVVGLEVERRGRARVTGVDVRDRKTGETTRMSADLVIDATGRGSKMLALLERAGVTPPGETVVDSGTWYSTRWFTAPPRHELPAATWWRAALVMPTLRGPGALMAPVEGDRWIVSIASVGRGQPAIDEDNFMATLRSLPSPIIAEAVGAPLSPVYGSRATPNRILHFDRWEDPVDGFVAIGDSVCAFNPIHGQGVSSTVVCARALEECLRDGGVTSPSLGARFFDAQRRWFTGPWSMATGFDLSFPTTPGKRPLAPKLFRPYTRLLSKALREDPALIRQAGEIGQLNAPFASLLSARSFARVLRSNLRQRLAPRAHADALQGAYPPPAIL